MYYAQVAMFAAAANRQLRHEGKRILASTCCKSSHPATNPSQHRADLRSAFHLRACSCPRFVSELATHPITSTGTPPLRSSQRQYFGTNADPEYHARAEQWGLASKEEVAKSALKSDTIWLDVRSPAEIEQDKFTAREHIYCHCTMDDTSKLAEQAHELFPDKNGTCCV